MTEKKQYNIEDIMTILPHRSPFLFVDRVKEITVDDKIIAEKDLSFDDHFFRGHFPGNPIMPGVLVSEALAQACGLLLGLTWKEKTSSLSNRKHGLFLANVNIKFFTPAKPGETLRLEASLKKTYGKLYLFTVAAYVVDNRIAKGELTLAMESS